MVLPMQRTKFSEEQRFHISAVGKLAVLHAQHESSSKQDKCCKLVLASSGSLAKVRWYTNKAITQ